MVLEEGGDHLPKPTVRIKETVFVVIETLRSRSGCVGDVRRRPAENAKIYFITVLDMDVVRLVNWRSDRLWVRP